MLMSCAAEWARAEGAELDNGGTRASCFLACVAHTKKKKHGLRERERERERKKEEKERERKEGRKEERKKEEKNGSRNKGMH